MTRRPSAVSLSSLNSNTASGLSKLARLPSVSQSPTQSPHSPGEEIAQIPARNASLGVIVQSTVEKGAIPNALDIDELFTKHSVSEVKAIQQQLRADADAKQEELRLMVGERYRDLLQASTSIIEIAQSSTNVLRAFEKMKQISYSARTPHLPKPLNATGQGGEPQSNSSYEGGDSVTVEDAHLQSMQSLSAHMKLLLDAPEHLWRLMEKRRYLHSAWLFLLARVVHQALLQEHDDDESSWLTYGIRVPEQLPLVQRQWDTVSQFRSQITHKATLFLREHTLLPTDVCAALLTLHLLESRPLPETISTFLQQRTRALTSLLPRSRPSPSQTSPEVANSPTNKKDGKPPRPKAATLNNVQRKLEAVLQVISQTLGTARIVFLGDETRTTSLMSGVLQYISAESSPPEWLPVELRLTTQSLLGSLPSSTHYGLLPANIKGYKPYIDDTSLVLTQVRLKIEEQMHNWFANATQDLEKTADTWLLDLQSIREIWGLRSSIRSWIRKDGGFQSAERAQLGTSLNDWCRKHAERVWKTSLVTAEDVFKQALTTALGSLRDPLTTDLAGAEAAKHLFQPLPPLQSTGMVTAVGTASFEKYRKSLQRRIAGRTPRLIDVLDAIGTHVRTLHDDLKVMKGGDDDTRALASQLLESYRYDAENLGVGVVNILQGSLSSLTDVTERTIRRIVFIGRVAEELSSSAIFTVGVDCSIVALSTFQAETKSIHDQSLGRWRTFVVNQIIQICWPASCVKHQSRTIAIQRQQPGPSPQLFSALLSLSNSIPAFGPPSDPFQRTSWIMQTLQALIQAAHDTSPETGDDASTTEFYWDLCFLQCICLKWDEDGSAVCSLLDEHITRLREKLSAEGVAESLLVPGIMSEQLSKTQLLFAAILPTVTSTPPSSDTKTTTNSLLRFGVPSVEAQYEPAVDIVKPGPRLGLLLVGS